MFVARIFQQNFTLVSSRLIILLSVLLISTISSAQQINTELSSTVDSSIDSPSIQTESNISITMRDGISLSLDVYRPSVPGQYPTLYAAGPYPHNDDSTIPSNVQTGPIAWFVSQGYNYVLASSRGTGRSEGTYELLSRDEQQDHYEVIEWIASQVWSNGKVAGVGASYYATAQWQMAIQNPPHLECIAPFNGVVQPYQDWAFPGGLASSEFSDDWYTEEVRMANAFPATGPAHIIEYDIELQQLLHPTYDEYWQVRSPLEYVQQISVPVFSLLTWDQDEPGLNGTLNAHSQLNSLNKFFITSNGRDNYLDQTFLEQELLPFYAWCLGDEQSTSFLEQAPVRYFAQGSDRVMESETWPPLTTQSISLFLNRQVDGEEDVSSLNSSTLRNNLGSSEYGLGTQHSSVRFLSEVLTQDIEIAGAVLMELYANSTNQQTGFEVVLSEQVVFRQITQNQTLASFLPQDNGSSTNLLSASNNIQVSKGVYKASPLSPNRVTRLDIPLEPSAYRFKRGNRILVEIRKSLDGSLVNKPSKEEVFHSARYPSQIWLPTIQSDNSTATQISNESINNTSFDNPESQLPTNFDFLNTESLEDDDADPVIFFRE